VHGGQPTYLTKFRKKEKPCGPAGKEQIGHRSRAGTGPDRVAVEKGRESRTGERESVNEARELPQKGGERERERKSVRVRASDALLLRCAFVVVLFFGLHSLSAFVLRRNFFARVVCTLSLERSSVCFIFRVVRFAVCFFGWSVSLQSHRRVSVAYRLLPGVYIALAAWWVVRHR
jgi:hypothetical protein